MKVGGIAAKNGVRDMRDCRECGRRVNVALWARCPRCYACCADRDREDMRATGRAVLYWDGSTLSNWPGTLTFYPYAVRTGRHNIAHTREDVWFIGPDMEIWHGVQYGQDTQLLHCRRLKGR